jgi:hypothetical protein
MDVEGSKLGDVEKFLGKKVAVGSRDAEAGANGSHLLQEGLKGGSSSKYRNKTEADVLERPHGLPTA